MTFLSRFFQSVSPHQEFAEQIIQQAKEFETKVDGFQQEDWEAQKNRVGFCYSRTWKKDVEETPQNKTAIRVDLAMYHHKFSGVIPLYDPTYAFTQTYLNKFAISMPIAAIEKISDKQFGAILDISVDHQEECFFFPKSGVGKDPSKLEMRIQFVAFPTLTPAVNATELAKAIDDFYSHTSKYREKVHEILNKADDQLPEISEETLKKVQEQRNKIEEMRSKKIQKPAESKDSLETSSTETEAGIAEAQSDKALILDNHKPYATEVLGRVRKLENLPSQSGKYKSKVGFKAIPLNATASYGDSPGVIQTAWSSNKPDKITAYGTLATLYPFNATASYNTYYEWCKKNLEEGDSALRKNSPMPVFDYVSLGHDTPTATSIDNPWVVRAQRTIDLTNDPHPEETLLALCNSTRNLLNRIYVPMTGDPRQTVCQKEVVAAATEATAPVKEASEVWTKAAQNILEGMQQNKNLIETNGLYGIVPNGVLFFCGDSVEDIGVVGTLNSVCEQELLAKSNLSDVIPYSSYSAEQQNELNGYILSQASEDGKFAIQLVNAENSHLLTHAIIQARAPGLSTDQKLLALQLEEFSVRAGTVKKGIQKILESFSSDKMQEALEAQVTVENAVHRSSQDNTEIMKPGYMAAFVELKDKYQEIFSKDQDLQMMPLGFCVSGPNDNFSVSYDLGNQENYRFVSTLLESFPFFATSKELQSQLREFSVSKQMQEMPVYLSLRSVGSQDSLSSLVGSTQSFVIEGDLDAKQSVDELQKQLDSFVIASKKIVNDSQ
jgi:hypothetical protein